MARTSPRGLDLSFTVKLETNHYIFVNAILSLQQLVAQNWQADLLPLCGLPISLQAYAARRTNHKRTHQLPVHCAAKVTDTTACHSPPQLPHESAHQQHATRSRSLASHTCKKSVNRSTSSCSISITLASKLSMV